jgi:hypothetical protein
MNAPKIIGISIASALVLILLAIFLIPGGAYDRPNPILWKIQNDARITAYHVLNYSHQVEHYPSSLEKIREQIGEDDIRHFEDPTSERKYEWIYFGDGMSIWDNPHQKILIASPTLFDHKGAIPTDPNDTLRVVAFADGHSEVIEESEYQKLITQPVDTDNPCNPPRNSKNQLDD